METNSSSLQPAPRRFKLLQAVVSDVGLKRDENQDSYGYAHTERVSFYIVADGMGGARGGATASLLAVNTVLRASFTSSGEVTEESLSEALILANEVIFERSREDESLQGMGTTIVVLVVIGDRIILGHVGDSRIYFLRNGKAEQLTRDHTLVQELVDSGAIKPEEAANHPIAHMLTRSLGPTTSVQPEVVSLPFPAQPGDRFLLCSDGLYNLVEREEIEEALINLSLEDATKSLLQKVLDRGASDNCTITVAELHAVENEGVDFQIPAPGKIRVVSSGEIEESAIRADESPPTKDEPPINEINASTDHGENEQPPSPEASAPPVEELSESARLNTASTRHSGTEEELAEKLDELKKLKRFALGAVVLAALIIPSTFLFSRAPRTDGKLSNSVVKLEDQRVVQPKPSATIERIQKESEKLALSRPVQTEVTTTTTPQLAPEAVSPTANTAGGGWPAVKISDDSAGVAVENGIDPEEEEILELAQTVSIPPAPRFTAANDFPTTPINWGAEEAAQRELPRAESVEAPKILTDQERKELLDTKVELREQIADTDIRFEILSLETEEAIQERRSKLEKQLNLAERASDRVKSELTKVEEQLGKWKARSKSGYSRELISELSNYDESLKRLDEDYQVARIKRQEALEAFGNSPRDSAVSQRLSEATKAEEERRVVVLQIAQRAISSQLSALSERRRALSIELEDLLRIFRRAGRQLGLTKFIKPNENDRNLKELERLANERNRLTTRYTEASSRFSDFAESEFRRDQVLK